MYPSHRTGAARVLRSTASSGPRPTRCAINAMLSCVVAFHFFEADGWISTHQAANLCRGRHIIDSGVIAASVEPVLLHLFVERLPRNAKRFVDLLQAAAAGADRIA